MSRSIAVEWCGRLSFAEGLRRQESLVAAHRAGTGGDHLLLLEHESVYTIGRTADRSSLGDEPGDLGAPIVETGRGGKATWHGPGQLVGYPVLDLTGYGTDLHRYLRALEAGLIVGCQALGVQADRREELTGVWVGDRKLASIGVGARHWISLHGFAINVDCDLAPFAAITPCGIAGVEMTTLAREGAALASVEAAATHFRPHVLAALEALAVG
jgi:lipoyl(octanoyl) transferase